MDLQNLKITKGNLFRILIVALNVFLVVLVVSTAIDIQNKIKEGKHIGKELEARNTITVSDTGKIYAKPDLALTTFSVATEAKTVAEALNKNTEKMNAVIDFVKKQGVEDKDLKTTSLNIYPRYEWRERAGCIPPCPSGKRVLAGYEVYQSLQVKIRNMEKIGQIIEGAAKKGANEIGDLQLTVDGQDELKKQAREQAINKAKLKAQELASQLGVNLVRITNFSESSVVPYYFALEKAEGLGGGGAPQPQIETGENKTEVTVTITYEIN